MCIHGYRQNEKMFREKTGAFRKIVGKHTDLVFITAPHAVQPLNEEDSNQVTYNQHFFRYSLIFRMYLKIITSFELKIFQLHF